MNITERLNAIRAHLDAIERELKPDASGLPWHEAPEWARWAAMDSTKQWYWFESQPLMFNAVWSNNIGRIAEFNAPAHPDWTQSKQRRPE
jgi:hypothetical protein